MEENGRRLSKQVENNVGKGEIARHEQFLLFPQCFQKACFPGASNGVVVWEWVKCREVIRVVLTEHFNLQPHMPILGSPISAANKNMMSKVWTNGVQLSDRVENIVGKEEIARYEQFLLFPQCFQKLSVVGASK